MYEENKRRINWVRLFLILIIVFLLLLLTLKCIEVIKNRNGSYENYYNKRLNSINEVALDYFNKDNIPDEVGKSTKRSLSELKDEKVNFELKAKKGDTCDLNESYIQATRLETEYQVKTYIECGEYKDYINTYVDLNKKKTKTTEKVTEEVKTTEATTEKVTEEVKTTEATTVAPTTTTTTKVVTTKKVTTTRVLNTTQATAAPATNNEVNIRFNANGGVVSYDSKTIKKGTSTELPVPFREGYNFVGWYYNGVKYTSSTKFDNSIILVAMWN